MRKVWLLASAVLAFLNFVKSQEVARTLYSTRYDNLDIDTILGSNRLVSNYVDCLLSRKPCPPEGKDLKRILPEALRTKCARCSPIQKENALKIITRLYYDYPDQYRALRERWDPSGEYHRRFEEYLRGLQFNQIGGGGSGSSNGGTGVGNTIESGGNDRPVRNDLDRQPASTQSSNVQPIVIDPTLAGQPVQPPSPQPPLAVTPATERPRPPAPVAQILFPTTTDTTNTTTTSTTTSTSTSNSGPVELTGDAPSASAPSNTVTIASSVLSRPSVSPDLLDTERDVPATAEVPVVPVPVSEGFPWPTVITTGTTVSNVGQSLLLQQGATSPREEEVSTVPQWLEAQLAQQQILPERPQESFAMFANPPFAARPVVVDGAGNQNLGTVGIGQLPLASAPVYDVPTATANNGSDELPTAPPPVVVNRFGDDGGNSRPSIAPVPAMSVPVPQTTTTQRPTTTTVRQTRPATRQTTTRNTQRTTTRFAAQLPPSPIVGLWNQLGTKIADTADAIAGMLQKTVDVLVTSHIQSHQRALRRS